MLGREPGFAVKVLRPSASPVETPPGQGQLLVPLRGAVQVDERSENATKVTQTDRRNRSKLLGPGHLWRVANDAVWSISAAEPDTVLLQVSTSVPRHEHRADDLLGAARSRMHMGPRRVFGNEVLRVETSVGRGVLPGVGWVWWDHTSAGAEYAVILAGAWRARLRGEEGEWTGGLEAGSLLRITPGVAHNFAARTMLRPSVGLILTSLRRVPRGRVTKESVQGFSPFVDRG
ncbi:MAG: hypothetical protein KDA24_15555 [Deltaproteobacteria bacterium]|nr:hypothetical protein [Deltaproteobacteria bacterium]